MKQKRLSDSELLSIVQNEREEDVEKLRLALLEQRYAYFQLQNTVKNEKFLAEISSAKSKVEGAKNLKRQGLMSIAKRHKLKEGWGFNPETGEIITGSGRP